MINLDINATVHGFRVLRTGEVPRCACHYWKLRHEATGATLYYSDRDDGQKLFSVGFRTLPEDDTGVFHILEHSCLDGSVHFPLKEPFVNLIKTSMATDLNAMTYSDKTIYYFISTNEQDYMNLMSVYLDAVFHPLLLSDRRIFEKEAWHLEPDGNGGVSVSGVVFNEMQGHENQPDYIMWMQNVKQLFPDLAYHTCNSGGDPVFIPDLTYEQFVETYNRFYSTQNAIIYLSGDMSLDTELAYIDRVLSEKGISAYEKPSPAPLQAPVISPDCEVFYQLPESEEPTGNTKLLLSFVTEADKPEQNLAFALLSRYLAENTESPLERAVLAADVGKDFQMGIESDYRQPMLFFMLGKTDPDKAEPFRRVILDTLATLAAEGFDKARLSGLIDSHETDCRRAAISVDTGFRIMEDFLKNHVQYDDSDPEDGILALRAAMAEDEHYFEHIVERFVLESEHWALTKCIPSRTASLERRGKMQERCAAESARIRAIEGGYDALTVHVQAFNEYLLAPDSPEAEASIPHLTPADLGEDGIKADMAAETAPVGGTDGTSLFYEAATDGMVHAGLYFDVKSIPEDDLFYVSCLRKAIFSLPTASHTLPELTDTWVRLHTNRWSSLQVEINDRAYLALSVDAPEERLFDAAMLLDEYIRGLVFDRTVLSNIFANASDMRDRMIGRGNATAAQAAGRSLTVFDRYHDLFSGLSAYRRYASLADRFDEDADTLIAGMTRVWRQLTAATTPIAYCIGSTNAYATWKNAIGKIAVAQVLPTESSDLRPAPAPRANVALTIPGGVNYCAELYDLREIGVAYSPRMAVINTHLYSRYFWDEIRAKGGAYGASASTFRQGIVKLTSYRDPRVADTYEVFSRLPDWMAENLPTREEVDTLIVSTASSQFFAPRSPMDKGHDALARYLRGKTVADRRADMAAVLATTPADFADYAAAIRRLQESGRGVRAVVGNADLIRQSGLFTEDEITEL